MVSESRRCGCGAFCRRLFCRDKPSAENDGIEITANQPVTLLQLEESLNVKFTQPLTQRLSIGSHIVCTGTPSEDIPWFSINIGFGQAESDEAEVTAHFNVRMPQCYVVRNNRHRQKWGAEETTSFRSFPFKVGQTFTVEIIVDETMTLWAVDGLLYCTFNHRLPNPMAATWIQVCGIKDASLDVNKTDVYPLLGAPPLQVPSRPSLDSVAQNEPIWRPHMMAVLPDGIPEGHQLVVRGRLRPLLHSFAIDLMDDAREWPTPNIHAHVNLRAFDESFRNRQLLVMNSRFGAWAQERRQRTAKLIPGNTTTFRIIRSPTVWSVYADDVLIGELEYRASPNGVRAMKLRGDLYPFEIYTCPSTTSPTRED